MGALRAGEAYGYQIIQRLEVAGGPAITESSVYPILARLAEEGYVKVRAAPSPVGPPRRYYRLTGLGQARLREMEAHWRQVNQAVEGLLKEKRDE
jgi:PadR family transcriptional regulator, regulatory protein PadR